MTSSNQSNRNPRRRTLASRAAAVLALIACAAPAAANIIADWSLLAANTVNAAGFPATTPEEQRPTAALDLATVHVAIYDAVNAIDHRYETFAATPAAPTAGASAESATGAATCRVLQVLFPNRSSVYSQACAGYLPSSTGTPAQLKGVAVGVDVADKILALRKDDGRSTVVTYTPTGTPGSFVPFPPNPTPVGINFPFVRAFTLTSAAQFRAYGPPDLTSARYARDLNESEALGGAVSATRTPEQEELARFATENPGIYTPRLIRSFADDGRSVVQNARLQAMMWVAQADVTISCFDSKYYFTAWRPRAAIPGADLDHNDATVADPTWLPFVPTPNHPEYPAAHTCSDGAVGETLNQFFGTNHVEFDVDSTVTGTVRHYHNTDDYVRDIGLARIYGGMHFRTSAVHGALMGREVAQWVATNHFRPLKPPHRW